MPIELRTPTTDELVEVISALRDFQREGGPFQLHPGDLGWFWRFGAPETAAAVRTWTRDGRILAIGLRDGDDLLRLTIAPDARQDEGLARRVLDDLADPGRGILGAGMVNVEAPSDAVIRELLAADGWEPGEGWTPLRRDLTDPVEEPDVSVEVVGPDRARLRVDIQRAAFERSTFTIERWDIMAGGAAYADARCLLAFGPDGSAVAAATVWSAGRGRPGILEPLGVHPHYRGRGYGREIAVASAGVLRALGASSAMVCTPTANLAAVATYRAAGFEALPEVHDWQRAAS